MHNSRDEQRVSMEGVNQVCCVLSLQARQYRRRWNSLFSVSGSPRLARYHTGIYLLSTEQMENNGVGQAGER